MQKNTDRNDPFLTGSVFSPGFFKLVQEISKEQPQEQLIKSAAQVLQAADPTLSPCTKLILDPSEENKADYAEAMGCSSDEALESAKEFLDKYTQAAITFFTHTDGILKRKIQTADPKDLCLTIQGEGISKEVLLRALKVDVESQDGAYFNQQVEWIREAIENADLTWGQKFVRIITGNTTLAPHSKLLIRKGWREVFEFHTRFNSLDLPPKEMSKENFLNALNACLSDTGYNIA